MESLEQEVRRRYLDRLDDRWGESEPSLDFGPSALPYFIEAFERETDSARRALLVGAICQFREASALPTLATALDDPSPDVWKEAIDGIVSLAGDQALAILKEARAATATKPAEVEKLEWIDEAISQLTQGFYPGREIR